MEQDNDKQKKETYWTCQSCGGRVTQGEHDAGQQICGTKGCERKGEPFTKEDTCEDCTQPNAACSC